MVTVAPEFEQAPDVPNTGAVLAFVVAVTTKLLPNGAFAGTPVNVVFGAAWRAVTDCDNVAGLKLALPSQFPVTTHVPVPLVIVTVLPTAEQAWAAVNVALTPMLLVPPTVNLLWYAAVAGIPVSVTAWFAFVAAVDCVKVEARKLPSAGQAAVRVHVPVLWVMVTVAPAIVQAPAAVIVAVVLAFVTAETTNVVRYPADAGAPVNVAAGTAFNAVVLCVADAAR
jgi:hypothetical protein